VCLCVSICVCLCGCLCVCLCVCLSLCLSVCLFLFFLYVTSASTYLFPVPGVCLCVCVCVSLCLSLSLSLSRAHRLNGSQEMSPRGVHSKTRVHEIWVRKIRVPPPPNIPKPIQMGVGVLLFCGPTFRERGFWNVPPVGTFPAIKIDIDIDIDIEIWIWI